MISSTLLVGKRNDCFVVMRSSDATTGTVTVTMGDPQRGVVTRTQGDDNAKEGCLCLLDEAVLSDSCTSTFITYTQTRHGKS